MVSKAVKMQIDKIAKTVVELNEDFFRTAQERIEETEATRICNISDYF